MMWAPTLVMGFLPVCWSLKNGLGLTPPMGWLSWDKYGCNFNELLPTTPKCNEKLIQNCATEEQIKSIADMLSNEGYLDAGYEYIVLDDCAIDKERGPDGRLVANRQRFPKGIKSLADYIHDKGLKIGMRYVLQEECVTYPESKSLIDSLVATFRGWKLDYVRINACLGPTRIQQDEGLSELSKLLNLCMDGRMLLYTNAPTYQKVSRTNYTWYAENCNGFQSLHHIEEDWTDGFQATLNYYSFYQDKFIGTAGPGYWHDLGKLVIGIPDVSVDLARAQMAMWAILPSPLFFTAADVTTLEPKYKTILLNKDIIKVHQDVMGKQGVRIQHSSDFEVWKRELHDDGAFVMAFINHHKGEGTHTFNFTRADLHLSERGYLIKDLYGDEKLRFLGDTCFLRVKINNEGVKFYWFKKGYLVMRTRKYNPHHRRRINN